MKKTILITGSTDGIGLETARMLVSEGHHVLLHGRNLTKLENTKNELLKQHNSAHIESYVSDLSSMSNVGQLAKDVIEKHNQLDVLINNAGVFNTNVTITDDELDVRFAVNTIAPYLLMKRLLPLMNNSSRVINLSSAAQAPVNLKALVVQATLSDEAAYAQSKLAITMWSRYMALKLKDKGPVIIAVNPGSLLATKMVKQAFGVAGGDIKIGAEILYRAALSDEFETMSGQYFDNDLGKFASAHVDASDSQKAKELVETIEEVLVKIN